MNYKRLEVFLEFLILGIIIGVVEDIIVIKVLTDHIFTLKDFGIIVLIAIPFAFVGEILVDKIDFAEILQKIFSKKNKQI